MKSFYLHIILFLTTCCVQAQVAVQNNGILFIQSSGDILTINGSFTNAATAALTNNGSFYISQQLANQQASMATGSGTLLLNGTSTQVVTGTQPFKTWNLVSNNTNGIMLNNNISVGGNHTFLNGIITTGITPNFLIYEAGSSYSGSTDSRHVSGWVKKLGNTNFIFPVGNGVVERNIALTGMSAVSEFNVTYFGATIPNPTSTQSPLILMNTSEYWTINKISGGTANVNLNWDNSKVPFLNFILSDVRSSYYNGSMWTNTGGSATGNTLTTGNIVSNTVGSFGEFGIGSADYVLNVRFINITAIRTSQQTIITWSATDETDANEYEVQRKQNGQFTTIAQVPARNLPGIQEYTYSDRSAMNGTTSYRIKATDKNGLVEYSKFVLVTARKPLPAFSIFSPGSNQLSITATGNEDGWFDYTLFNVHGQQVSTGKVYILAGGVVNLTLPSISTGIYVMDLKNAQMNFRQKVLIR